MTMLEDKKCFGEDRQDWQQAEDWLAEPHNPNFRSICNVIKDLDEDYPEAHEACLELIWIAKKITNKLHEYREKARENSDSSA